MGKVKFIGDTNIYFTNGTVYEAEQEGQESIKISLAGTHIVFVSHSVFNAGFDTYREPNSKMKRAKYTGNTHKFTYGKVYQFVHSELDKKATTVYHKHGVIIVDREFFDRKFNVVDDAIKSEPKKQYMVSVQDGQAPKKTHDCPVLAGKEADRLATQSKNIGKTVYILEVKKMIKSKIVLEAL